jgi:hypothetical protein
VGDICLSGFPVPKDSNSTQTESKHKWEFIGSLNYKEKGVIMYDVPRNLSPLFWVSFFLLN